MPLSDIIRFVPVSDLLATSGQPTEDQLRQIAEAGIACIINLGLHDDRRYALADEAGLVASLGMRYIHIPVQFAAPTREDLQSFFTALHACEGLRTLVHCAHNKRVSVFLALHRVLKLGWSIAQASAAMRETWIPDENWQRFFDEVTTEAGRE